MTMQKITKDSYMVQTVQQRKVQNAQCAQTCQSSNLECAHLELREKSQ